MSMPDINLEFIIISSLYKRAFAFPFATQRNPLTQKFNYSLTLKYSASSRFKQNKILSISSSVRDLWSQVEWKMLSENLSVCVTSIEPSHIRLTAKQHLVYLVLPPTWAIDEDIGVKRSHLGSLSWKAFLIFQSVITNSFVPRCHYDMVCLRRSVRRNQYRLLSFFLSIFRSFFFNLMSSAFSFVRVLGVFFLIFIHSQALSSRTPRDTLGGLQEAARLQDQSVFLWKVQTSWEGANHL